MPLQVILVDTWYIVSNKVENVLQPRVAPLPICNIIQLCIRFSPEEEYH